MTTRTNHFWNKYSIFILALLCSAFLYLLAPILLPFVAGALIAYLSRPLVNKLVHHGVPHLLAVIIVFSVVFLIFDLLIFFLIPALVQRQVATLSVQLPHMIAWVQNNAIPWVTSHFGLEDDSNVEAFKNIFTENSGDAASWIWKTMLHSGKALFETILDFILIPVVTFYLLRDWDKIITNIRNSIPRTIRPTVIKLTRECDSVLGGFFRGQLSVMVALTIMYAIGLSIVGLQLSMVIALIIGVTSIVPYLGFIIGIFIAVIAALVQFGTLSSVLWVLLVFAIGHSIENFYLTPKLIGKRIGLHPIVVIFAILAGGTLFGFFGVLLALPAAAIIMVLLRHVHQRYALA
jgi:predicted PurR-regulated permease PerM